MRIVANFDPTNTTDDTFNAGFSNGTGKMVVYNESNINLLLSWGSFQTYCPAWTAMLYCVSTNNVNINWQAQSTLQTSGSPISQVIVEVYDPGEPVLGTFPAPLVRQTNIGNTVTTTSVGNSSAIINDGNIIGTSVIESTPAGDAHSAVTLNNVGQLVLGDNTHPGSITSDNGAFATDGTGFLTLLKALLTGGLLGKVTPGDILDASGGTSLTLKSINGDVIIQNGLTEIGRFTSGTNGGALNLPGAQRTINGSTSGTCTCYQLTVGIFKICLFQFNNWRNGAAGNQFISVPIAYTFGEHGINGGCGTFQLIKSGGAQTVQILTTLASGGGGVTGVTSVNNNSIWHCDTGFDSLALAGSDAGAHTGTMVIFGI